MITAQWYRRAEQPVRVAAWYGTNGIGNIVAAGLSVGLSQIHSDILKSWQMWVLFPTYHIFDPKYLHFLDNIHCELPC